jgi:4-hydroxyphenylpyruvate dioxygenase
MNAQNPLGMRGLSFVELAGDPKTLHQLLSSMGFSRTRRHRDAAASVYVQHEMTFVVNDDPRAMAVRFKDQHGPCVSALGIVVEDARAAFTEALRRGAKAFVSSADSRGLLDTPAIVGIGGSLIYFVDGAGQLDRETVALESPNLVPSVGFLRFDHLTNNVAKGDLARWADFYKSVFGFTEVRSFDITGAKTGLYSYALRSPCGSLCIPINEDKDERGQIAEYLREYHGPGIQHVAFLTEDLLGTLDAMKDEVATLDIDDDYYDEVFTRVPNVTEDPTRIRSHQVLVDGDDQGYLLQIFTKNCVGPIFFEFIQRHNHLSFGEGNFGALFRSIERDQERRGVI